MLFTVLGPVSVSISGRSHVLPRAQRRAVLGYLLLNANRVVTPDGIVSALWAGAEPRSARNQVHAAVSVVRGFLRDLGHPDLLVRSQAGYLLAAKPDQLDLHVFEDLVRRARSIAAGGQSAIAAGLFRTGLELWSGQPLGGATGAYVEAARAHLTEQRLAATEELLDQELACGQHHDVVAELGPLIAAHPFRERFHAQLMLALYRSGRQADALEVYRDARRTLADELGLEPGIELRRLERAVLNSDPALDLPAPAAAGAPAGSPGSPVGPVPPGQLGAPGRRAQRGQPGPPGLPAESGPIPIPAQLPADVPGFTGRAEELRRLDELAAGATTGGAVVIAAIAGTAGVGKTALAVHWCRAAAARFPDGQLYVNLRGYDPGQPVHPSIALAGFLRALGLTTNQIPAELDEAAALYRSRLSGRRVLVLLDNAASAEQVRPLLPGDPGCLVVVTSRNRLSGLVARDGAHRLALDLLSSADAVTLVGRLLGARRVSAEPGATAQLAAVCGRLPLAVRVAAANLAGQPDRPIAAQVAAMSEDRRLAMLAIDGDDSSAVRIAFQQSYASLEPGPRRLFRLLGLVAGPDFDPAVAATLVEVSQAEAGRLLDRLAEASLTDPHPDSRHTFHDLTRLFARERADADESSAELAGARGRLFDYYIGSAHAASRLLYPNRLRLSPPAPSGTGFTDPREALAWLDRELANLVAAALEAGARGPREASWMLADILRSHQWRRMSIASWKATSEAGLAAAVAAGELRPQAALALSLGLAHAAVGEYARAIEYNSRAVALSLKTGWREVQAIALTNLGSAYLVLGWLHHAADHYQRALEVNTELGRKSGRALSLGNLGSVYLELGQLERAATYLQQAVDQPELADSSDGGATALLNLGTAHFYLGNFDLAEERLTVCIQTALRLSRTDLHAPALAQLAAVNLERGRPVYALEQAKAALSVLEDTGDRYDQAMVLSVIGTVHQRRGQYKDAIDAQELAVRYAQQTDSPFPQAMARIGLAGCHHRLGHSGLARRFAEQALEVARQVGYRLLEGQALTTLADIDLTTGDLRLATAEATQALAIHQEVGHRLGAAQAVQVLANAGSVVVDQSGGSS